MTRSTLDGNVVDDEERRSTRERRRLDQRVGMNVDGQVSRMCSGGGLHTTVRVRPVNEVLHQELLEAFKSH